MIALQKVQKVVEQRTELEIEALNVAAGEVAAIVGASGSGIDVLLPLLTGQTRPTGVSVRVAECDPACERLPFSRQVGVLFAEDTQYSTTRTPNLAC